MSAATDSSAPRKGRLGLILGLVLAPLLAGTGFWAAYTGLLPGLPDRAADGGHAAVPEPVIASFVPVDPITINIGAGGQPRQLRFVAQLEVPPEHAAEVARLMPRIVDVLNTYLRAVDPPELEEPSALTRLRAQMLRRVQIVAGPGRVSDLLVMEFVFN